MPTALLVDDDPSALGPLGEWVGKRGFDVTTAATASTARAELRDRRFDVAVFDLELPDGSGLELLEEVERSPAETEVLLVTGHESVESAVHAFRGGAVDYLTKPVDLRRMRRVLANVTRTLELRYQIDDLRSELRALGRFGPMRGASPAIQEVYDLCLRVAPTDASVFVCGETGTGKELVAQAIHALSPRGGKPWVPVNCGALPAALVESELFGHERGSFTGADRQRHGVFEQADGGTLFLDEITEMPVELQARLLRVLETGQVCRVGGTEAIPFDVRLIAATNRDPQEAVASGRLRRDLLYRLLVFPLELPALRERTGDIELLARGFLDRCSRRDGVPRRLTPEAVAWLESRSWPGNVRELEHAIESAVIVCPGETIGPEALGARVAPGRREAPESAAEPPEPTGWLRIEPGSPIHEMERRLILATLDDLDGDKRAAARALGISLKTLYNRLNVYGAMGRNAP